MVSAYIVFAIFTILLLFHLTFKYSKYKYHLHLFD